MKILVTGGAGFIGSHVVAHFQGIASEIRVLDNLRTGYLRNLEGLTHTFIAGSVTDRAVVREAVAGVDYVFHLAALVSVPESMPALDTCIDINVTGLLNVLREAADAGVKKVVLASSAAVYGDSPIVPKVETMTPEPKSPYAITKLDGEHYCELFQREGLVPTASLRFFNVFGPRQDPTGAYAAAVPIFIERALAGQTITIYGDGEQTRDFIYVKDVVGALVFAATHPDLHGAHNVGYGDQITIRALAERIVATADTAAPLVFGPQRAGDVRHSRAGVDKLRAAGWRPAHGLDDGIAATFAFFRGVTR